MSIFGVPINVAIELFNVARSFKTEQEFQDFINETADPFNERLTATAESLGPITPTTTLAAESFDRGTGFAADQFQSAKNTAAGLSNQNTIDVNRRFDKIGAAGQASLSARGFGGSTLGSSLAFANERNRSDELRRVTDDRIRTLLGVEQTFGGRQIDTEFAFSGEQIRANEFAVDARFRGLEGELLFPPAGPRDIATRSGLARN